MSDLASNSLTTLVALEGKPTPNAQTREIPCKDLMTLGHSLDLIRHSTVYGALNSNPTFSRNAVAPPGKKSHARVSIPAGHPIVTISMAGILNVYFQPDYGFNYGFASYSNPPKPQIMTQYDASVELIQNFMGKSASPWEVPLKTDTQRLFNFALRVTNNHTLADEHQNYNDENDTKLVENSDWWWVRESMLALAGSFATKQSIPQLEEMRSYVLRKMSKKQDSSVRRSLPELNKLVNELSK